MRSRVLDPCTIIRVQTWDSQSIPPKQVDTVVGVAWPRETGAVASGGADVICVGPTDWLIVAPDSDAAALMQGLDAVFQGSTFRATNVSQALVRIEIAGPETRELLAKGCSLDLHPPLFPPGRSARTRFAGMPVIVRCLRNSTFECIIASSYQAYLVSWLVDAAIEFSDTLASTTPFSY